MALPALAGGDWPTLQLDSRRSGDAAAGAIRLPLGAAWSAELGSDAFGFGSAVLNRSTVFAGAPSGRLAAFDRKSGALLWTFDSEGAIHLAPAVEAGVLYFGSAEGRLFALDASSGAVLWAFDAGSNIHTSPAVSGGAVFFGSNAGAVAALDARTGALLWRADLGADYLWSAPAVDTMSVYGATLGGSIFALDRSTGTVRWSVQVPAEVRATPAVDGGSLFIGADDGLFRALDARTGAPRWTFAAAEAIVGAPAVSSGTVYFGSLDKTLYAVNKADGALRWRFTASDAIYSSPIVIDGLVAVGSIDGNLHLLDSRTGALLSRVELSGRVAAALAAGRGSLFAATDAGVLHALRSPNRPPAAPADLRVNAIPSPAINASSAAFTWSFKDPDPADAQAAFVLRVASGSRDFERPVVDSGLVDSATSSFVLSGLLEEGTYFWKVQTYDLFDGSGPFTSGDDAFIWDRTPPRIAVSSPSGGEGFVATRSSIRVAFSVTDNLDPAPRVDAALVQLRDDGSPRGHRPARVAVSSASLLDPFSLDDGAWRLEVAATDFAGNVSTAASGAFEVLHDVRPPRTSVAVGAPRAAGGPGEAVFVTSRTAINLSSVDDLVESGDSIGLGVAFQRLSVDGVTRSTFANPAPSAGQVFSSSFTLSSDPDGLHALSALAGDTLGNAEQARVTTVAVDNTPPLTALAVQGGGRRPGPGAASLYVSSDARVGFAASDPVINGVASGLASTSWQDGGGPFQVFASPFSLPEGAHALAYRSEDRLGNVEVLRSTRVLVDATAPVSSATVGSPSYVAADGTCYITPASELSFSAADPALPGGPPGSGIGRIEAAIDGGPFAAYGAALRFAEGSHTVLYRAVDNVGNVEPARVLQVRSDATAPVTGLSLLGGRRSPGPDAGSFFASSDTLYALPAVDPIVQGVASGLAFTRWQDNGAPFQAFGAAFGLAEGSHALAYQSQDNVGNLEVLRSTRALVDATAPRTTLAVIGGARYPGPDAQTFYASSVARYALPAVDPAVNGVASGVGLTEFSDNGGASQAYGAPFTLPEGAHALSYRSRDRVANFELLRSSNIWVDATPPASSFAFGAPYYAAPEGRNFVAPATRVGFAAADPPLPSGQAGSGVGRVETASDGGPFAAYVSSLAFSEGPHAILFRSIDNVLNLEAARLLEVTSDGTAPDLEFSTSREPVVRPPNNEPWFPGNLRILWTATDTASGVAFVEPATEVTREGRGLRFVGRAVDNVANAAFSTATLNLDKTPPAVSAGRPFEVFEGHEARFDATITDNLDEAVEFSWAFGDGGAAGRDPRPVHVYADNGGFDASLTATDHAGHVSTGSVRVTVKNAEPVVEAGQDRTVAEGGFLALASTFSDAGRLDTHTAGIDWGDGARSSATVIERDGAGSAAASHVYGDDGVYTVTVTVIDKDGGVGQDSLRVTVTNVAPTLASLPDQAALEGAFIQLPPAAFTDPGFDAPSTGTREDFSATVDWGDGTSEPAADIAVTERPGAPGVLTSGRVQARHAYGDNGTYPVTVTVTDDDGGASRSTFTVSVDNVAPAVDAGRAQVAAAGGAVLVGGAIPVRTMAVVVPGEPEPRTLPIGPSEPVAIPAVFCSDPGFDNPAPDDPAKATREDFTASIDWGDGTGSSAPEAALTEAPGREGLLTTGTVSAPHRYAANGIYLVTPTVTDDDQGAGTGAMRITADVVPPATSISHAGNISRDPGLPRGTSVFLDGAATSLLSATDPPVNGIAFGVQWTFRRDNSIDGTSALFTLSNGPFNLPQEGMHVLEWFSVDNRGNEEGHKLLTIAVDTTPPASSLSIGEPRYRLPDVLLVSSRTPFAILAFDPVSREVASGVKDTVYRVSDEAPGAAPFGAFTAAFTLAAPDAVKLIEFRSRDKVLNTEVVRSSTVLLDSTPPELALLSPPACDSGICRVLKGPRLPVLGTAKDPRLRDYRLEYAPLQDATSGFVRISSGGVSVSSGVLGIWDTRTLSGWLTLRLTAADLVENASALAVNVFVGDPGELLTLGDHEVFNMPEGVAVGSDGNIYVADRNDDRIAVFSATGTPLASFGGREREGRGKASTAALRLNKPSGVAVDGAGNVYVADTNHDRVLKLSAAGEVLLDIGRRKVEREDGKAEVEFEGGRGPGEFKKPAGVAVDAAGAIYVSDRENRRVQVFTSTGGFAFLFSLPPAPEDDEDDEEKDEDDGEIELGKPAGIALDGAGRIYVADPKGRRALVFGRAGQLLLTIPIPGDKPGQTGQPHGVAVSTSGNCLLVSDRKLGRVLKFDSQGGANLVFGRKGKLKDDDERQEAGIVLNKPMGLALDAAGSLYVADRNNDRVRKFSLPTGRPPLVVPPPGPENEHVAREVIDREEGGEVRRKDKAAVSVPAQALGEDLKISVSTPAAGPADESDRRKALADLALKPASPPVEFSPEGTSFEKPVTLTIPYSPKLAEAQGVAEGDLKVAYWNRDKGRWEELESSVDKKSKTVKAKTTHFSLYQVISGTASARAAEAAPQADPTFLFRDLYVFPNPARAGARPTIHLAVGVADKVTLRIFDVAGREVHRASLADRPSVIDDGKGPLYAYEYAWAGHIPSGVYLFTVEAEKAGAAAVRKAGRFAVVR